MNHLACIVMASMVLLAGCTEPHSSSLADRLEQEQLTIAAYGPAEIQQTRDRISLTRTGSGGAGLMIELGPEAGETLYSVAYTVASDAPVTLRTTEDGKSVYRSGDKGFFKLGGKRTQALIYSDEASKIDLEFGAAVDCAHSDEWSCYTFDEMRKEIFPEGEPEDTRTHLLTILDWVSNNADMSDFPDFAIEATDLIGRRTAAEMYADAYLRNRAGGYCGVTAVFMRKVLEEFGYQAFTIDFGVTENSMTHVTTVVYDAFGEGKFYILDPTFNFTVTRPDGSWAPVREIVSERPVEIVERPADRDQLVPAGAVLPATYSDCTENGEVAVCKVKNDNLARYMQRHAAILTELGLEPVPASLLSLLRRQVYSITGGNEETRAALRSLLK